MTGLLKHFRTGRFVWTVLATFYFLVFFRNFMADALPENNWPYLAFAFLVVLWMGLEYYFGSPFFQSGVFEHSALWRGVFAFFVYPFFGYVAADFIWWRWTQIPVPAVIAAFLGLLVFGVGTWVRLGTLFGLLRIAQVKPPVGRTAKQAETVLIPEKKLVGLAYQRLSRHPRYFGTFLQLVGAAIIFSSWGGLVLAGAVGLPLILLQVKHEDGWMRAALKGELQGYIELVPLFWPRLPARG